MKIFSLIITALLLTNLSACSEQTNTTDNQAHSRVSKDNVFSDQVRALEKAEQLEDQMMDAFKKRNASIDN